jgi:hypothetical protein
MPSRGLIPRSCPASPPNQRGSGRLVSTRRACQSSHDTLRAATLQERYDRQATRSNEALADWLLCRLPTNRRAHKKVPASEGAGLVGLSCTPRRVLVQAHFMECSHEDNVSRAGKRLVEAARVASQNILQESLVLTAPRERSVYADLAAHDPLFPDKRCARHARA